MHPLLTRIQPYPSLSALVQAVAMPTQGVFTISFCNAHTVNMAVSNPAFAATLLNANLILRDGIGAQIGMRWLGLAPGANLNGTDSIPLMLAKFKGTPIALYGTAEPWLNKSAAALTAQGHTIVAQVNGFQPIETYLHNAQTTKPSIIVLAMGIPKQEEVAHYLKNHLTQPTLIINGGAVLDFIGQRFTRAPFLFRKLGLEWVYRLMLEPKRLWHRYVIGNIVFLARLFTLRPASGRRA